MMIKFRAVRLGQIVAKGVQQDEVGDSMTNTANGAATVVELDPAEAAMRARILELMGQHAVSPLLEATLDYLRTYPNSGWGWLVSAPTLIDLGRYDDARAALSNAKRCSSAAAKPSIFYWRCILHKERGSLKKAQYWITKAIASDTGNASFRITLGDILTRRGKLKAAAKVLSGVIKLAVTNTKDRADSNLDSNLDEAHFNLALVRRSQRRYADALEQVERALVLDPTYAEALELKADLDAVLRAD